MILSPEVWAQYTNTIPVAGIKKKNFHVTSYLSVSSGEQTVLIKINYSLGQKI